MDKKIWIVVPVFNRVEPMITLLECLSKQTFQDYVLVLVDHGNNPLSEDLFYRNTKVEYLKESPDLWWSGAINSGIKYVQQHASESDLLLLQNDDATFNAHYLENLARHAKALPEAVIGGPIFDTASKHMLSGVRRLSRIKARFPSSPIGEGIVRCDVLPGRGMLVPIQAFKQVGIMKEDKLPHYAADDEFSYRLKKAGYSVYCAPDCQVYTSGKLDKSLASNLLDYLFDKRRPGNLSAIYYFAFESFDKWYAVYYILINVLRSVAVYFLRLRNYNA